MKKRRYLKFSIAFAFLTGILFLMIYTFILQNNYKNNALNAAVERNINCSDAIHKVVSNKFTKEDFEKLTMVDDMQSERYQQLQQYLNEIRSLNSTRYLYTAKRGDDGKLIYLVDGLDLEAEDFAYPGTYIEEEMIPYIEDALEGKTTYSEDVLDTTWGHIFTACYPVTESEDSDESVGALCIEMDMEDTYSFLEKSRIVTIIAASVAGIILILLGIGSYLTLHRYREKEDEQKEILQKAVKAADEANRAKSTFLFNMSHDIRTPMNAVIGYANLSEKHLREPDVLRDYLEKIRHCGQKMLNLIDNILELARIENGKMSLEESITDVSDSFDLVVDMFREKVQEKQQTLKVTRNIRYPYLYMDDARVSEIAINILSNAVKYTGEGGVISCELNQCPGDKEDWSKLEITIADTGIGMSEEFQKHIFESFSRERSSSDSGIEGSGLGMGIVKKLVDLMDGTIEVKSRQGEGSTFRVIIPLRIATEEEKDPKRAGDLVDKKAFEGKRLILTEDNDLNAEIAMELLGEYGLIIDRAADGVECIEMLNKAEEDYYSFILMDIQMPVMNGYETTKRIRSLPDRTKSQIPIIAMTANAFEEDRQMALASGMDDHIAKPIDMNILLPTIMKYI